MLIAVMFLMLLQLGPFFFIKIATDVTRAAWNLLCLASDWQVARASEKLSHSREGGRFGRGGALSSLSAG